MIDETGKDPERVGFCQDCGRPLTRETVRTVGSGLFCEPCLEVRINAAATPYGTAAGPNMGSGVPPSTEPLPPIGGSDPSPALAAVLGVIPGVGAMYNGQFAKGIAHIVIFVLLDSMAHVSNIFGILVAGWVFYQAFEAYHTARARREGLPLPDPFGLNNIAEQLGVHFRRTNSGAPPNPVNYPGSSNYPGSNDPGTNYAGWTGYVPPQPIVTPPPQSGPQPVQPVAEPRAQAWAGAPVQPPVAPYAQSVPVWDTPAWTPPPPSSQPGAAAGQDWANTSGYYPPANARDSRFPGAAAWLIGFGLLFLVLNFVPELRFSIHKIFPFFLMGLAVLIFVRRMHLLGHAGLAEPEDDAFPSRAALILRGPAIIFTLGVLLAFQAFNVFRFSQTWPVLVIVIGLTALLERSLGPRVVPVVVVPPDASVPNGDGKGF